MFKKMKLGTKIIVGFAAILLITAILGLVSYVGLHKIDEKSELAAEGLEILDLLNECATYRRDFGVKGFENYDGQTVNAVDKWNKKFEEIYNECKILKSNPKISDHQVEMTKDAIEYLDIYKKLFDDVKVSVEAMDQAFANWGKVGNSITKDIATLKEEIINPRMEQEKQAGNWNEYVKWSNYSTSLDEDIFQAFLLLRVKAVYLIATHKQEQWSGYKEQLDICIKNLQMWTKDVTGQAELEKVANTLKGYFGQYSQAGIQYYDGILSKKQAETNMGKEASNIVASIKKIEESLTGQMHSIIGKATSTVFILLTVCLISGAVFAAVITMSIVKPIRRIINELTEGSEQVSSAASQVSSASQSLAEGATEQAAGLEETSSSLEEMSSMTKQNADNANQANALSSQTSQSAQQGTEAMGRMNTAISDIQKSSEETSKIIKVIDEIAFQTNLLALNAAVEAARAGEAGKGFAVVAEEVRNLAMRSAEAAKNTTALIDQSVKNSQNGVEVAGEVNKKLEEITSNVTKSSELIAEIAAASNEQAQGIEQVNQAVTQMDKVTQSNAANAEESASAAEELTSQASSVNEIVGQLIAMVGGNNSGASRATVKSAKKVKISSPDIFHDIANSKGSAKKAEDVIPMNEKEFSDFG